MSPDAWIMLVILAGMFGLLIWSRLPPWAIFIATLAITMTLQLAPEPELLKGFANPAVWTVGALYVVAAGMYSTGAITIYISATLLRPHDACAAGCDINPMT